MMRSLYSGVSGLRNHQTRMDVIGNNIANVNTVGYKTSRTTFQDIFSQTASGGSANQGYIGGTNPMQIGLGIKLGTVDVLHTPAPMARTDNPYDMMVEGDGYFILATELDADGFGSSFLYTRAGNFYMDNEGYLVSSHGYYVMAYSAYPEFYDLNELDPDDPDYSDTPGDYGVVFSEIDTDDKLRRIQLRVVNNAYDGVDDPTDPDYEGPPFIDLVGFSVGQDGSISVIYENEKRVIGMLGLGMFSNPNGLEKAGNSLYRAGPSSGEVVFEVALRNGAGRVNGGGLEMSNVDLASEFTDMIVTQRGFQANSRIITVSDSMLEELVNLKR